eukprot:4216265-Pleurochrysis_carterae.AAC.2
MEGRKNYQSFSQLATRALDSTRIFHPNLASCSAVVSVSLEKLVQTDHQTRTSFLAATPGRIIHYSESHIYIYDNRDKFILSSLSHVRITAPSSIKFGDRACQLMRERNNSKPADHAERSARPKARHTLPTNHVSLCPLLWRTEEKQGSTAARAVGSMAAGAAEQEIATQAALRRALADFQASHL